MCQGVINLFDSSTENMKSVMFSCYATKVSFFVFHLIRHMLYPGFLFVLINF